MIAEAVLEEVDTYVSHLQNTVVQFISTRPIIYLCMVADQLHGVQVSQWWWEQGTLDLERIQVVARAAEIPETEKEE